MHVLEPIHTTQAGWNRLYLKHRDETSLLLAIVDYKKRSDIRWDLLQMDPIVIPKFPEVKSEELRELWITYLRSHVNGKLPDFLRWGSFDVYGKIPVLKENGDSFAKQVRAILESIPVS
jgi:hypothetical protein